MSNSQQLNVLYFAYYMALSWHIYKDFTTIWKHCAILDLVEFRFHFDEFKFPK